MWWPWLKIRLLRRKQLPGSLIWGTRCKACWTGSPFQIIYPMAFHLPSLHKSSTAFHFLVSILGGLRSLTVLFLSALILECEPFTPMSNKVLCVDISTEYYAVSAAYKCLQNGDTVMIKLLLIVSDSGTSKHVKPLCLSVCLSVCSLTPKPHNISIWNFERAPFMIMEVK